jgi:hypothetical protein
MSEMSLRMRVKSYDSQTRGVGSSAPVWNASWRASMPESRTAQQILFVSISNRRRAASALTVCTDSTLAAMDDSVQAHVCPPGWWRDEILHQIER